MRILLVEDDAASREALGELLELAGHRVVSAENGKAALDRLAGDEVFSVILLDVMMPVMDGFEFRTRQLDDPRIAAIPVIIVTADSHAREQAEDLKVERYLQKPISPKELLRTVREFAPPEASRTV